MHNPPDILALAYKQPVMQGQMALMQERERQIPGSIEYSIRRYHRLPQWNMDDTGMMVYHYKKASPEENYLELKFCVSGNTYCRQKDTECNSCKMSESKGCSEKRESVDVLSFKFSPAILSQFVKSRNTANLLS